jgi:hypothetical protein
MKKQINISLLLAATAVICSGCGQDVKMVEVDPVKMVFSKTTQSDKVTAKALDMISAEVPGVHFTYSSENPSVASVTSDGLVKPEGDGSTHIIAKTKEGVTGECFVSVCLPGEMICEPVDELKLKVGTAAPIRCHVVDCNEKLVQNARIEFVEADSKMVLKEEPVTSKGRTSVAFIGLAVGDTTVTAKSLAFEEQIKVHIDEQTYLPGMGPDSGGGGGGGKKKGDDDPYGGAGNRFDHILGNMKFN